MNYKHPNLFVMIPYEERNRVSGYFDLSVVGEEYAKLLGDLTDELSTYVAAFHIKPKTPGCAALMGVSRYAAFISADEYGVMVGGFLVNVPGGKEKARHIFINAAGCCEVVPRYAVVGAAGWQSEVG